MVSLSVVSAALYSKLKRVKVATLGLGKDLHFDTWLWFHFRHPIASAFCRPRPMQVAVGWRRGMLLDAYSNTVSRHHCLEASPS